MGDVQLFGSENSTNYKTTPHKRVGFVSRKADGKLFVPACFCRVEF
jgi:hypothetical protein